MIEVADESLDARRRALDDVFGPSRCASPTRIAGVDVVVRSAPTTSTGSTRGRGDDDAPTRRADGRPSTDRVDSGRR